MGISRVKNASLFFFVRTIFTLPMLPRLGILCVLLTIGACATERPLRDVTAGTTPAVDDSISHRFRITPNIRAARNIILFVGDGMGVSTVTAARIFDGQSRGGTGEENSLAFETFPHVALIKTYNTNQQVPDSAGTASAMMTGIKTRAGVISVGPDAPRRDCAGEKGNALTTIGELAERQGKSTGVVTNTRITHATPASVYAHSSERDFESDGYMTPAERVACTDIARQLLAFDEGDGLDVMFGGGYGEFVGKEFGGTRYSATENLITDWVSGDGRRVFIDSKDQLGSLRPEQQVLGLFAKSHIGYRLNKEPDSSEPTLAAMTTTAIDLLANDNDGYFLMVEGGRIDHGHHIGRAGVALREAQAFSETIAATLAKVDLEETLILVTADHSHVFTIAGYPTRGNPILGLVTGNDDHGAPAAGPKVARDGQPYSTVSYANGPGWVQGERGAPDTSPGGRQQSLVPTESTDRDGTVYVSESHGGEDVALYAIGPWSHLVGGVLEQNAIFHIMKYAYGW